MDFPPLFADKCVQFLAQPLRCMGYDVETVTGTRNKDTHFWLTKDSSIRRYCERTGRILITADMGLYYYCEKIGQQCIPYKDFKGILSSVEGAIIVDKLLGGTYFESWTSNGMPHWERQLHFNGGDWGKISDHTKNTRTIRMAETDVLGYSMLGTKEEYDAKRRRIHEKQHICADCGRSLVYGKPMRISLGKFYCMACVTKYKQRARALKYPGSDAPRPTNPNASELVNIGSLFTQ